MGEDRPVREIVTTDIDSSLLPKWQEGYIRTRKAILECLGFKLLEVIIRPSGEALPWLETKTKGKGFHVWWHIETPKPLSDLERLELQFYLGDDTGRIWINHLRITERHNPHWEKIFGYITWRSPLPEPCKSCMLRKYLEEISKCHT